jgi:hypothetical protein
MNQWGGGIGAGFCPIRPKMPLLTELENLFGWGGGYKNFAPTALPITSSMLLSDATLAGAAAKIELSAAWFHGKLWPLCSK